jgi:hypothetical protein
VLTSAQHHHRPQGHLPGLESTRCHLHHVHLQPPFISCPLHSPARHPPAQEPPPLPSCAAGHPRPVRRLHHRTGPISNPPPASPHSRHRPFTPPTALSRSPCLWGPCAVMSANTLAWAAVELISACSLDRPTAGLVRSALYTDLALQNVPPALIPTPTVSLFLPHVPLAFQ